LQIFFAKHGLNLRKEFWRYSNITCSAYPLEGLDTVDSDGKIAWNAALSYVVNGSTDDHLDMLEIGVVKRLLEDKWSTYAQVTSPSY
jgi:transient receptor potential cation channel subfamily V protein 6